MDWPTLITLGPFLVVGIVLGFVFGRHVWPTPEASNLRGKLTATQMDNVRLLTECESSRGRYVNLEEQLRSVAETLRHSGEEVARLTERTAQLNTKVQDYSA